MRIRLIGERKDLAESAVKFFFLHSSYDAEDYIPEAKADGFGNEDILSEPPILRATMEPEPHSDSEEDHQENYEKHNGPNHRLLCFPLGVLEFTVILETCWHLHLSSLLILKLQTEYKIRTFRHCEGGTKC